MSRIFHGVLLAQVVARNAVPLIGILVDGWSAANVVVLYFLDTLLSLGVLFAGLATTFLPAANSFAGRVRLELTCVSVAGVACALLALPLGVPVGIVLTSSDFSFLAAFHDRSLRQGALVQCALAGWSYVSLRRELVSRSPAELGLKQRFGLVVIRWFALLGACYLGLSDLGRSLLPDRGVLLFLVVIYVLVSIVAALAPDRLLQETLGDSAKAGGRRAPGR